MNIGGAFKVLAWLAPVLMITLYLTVQLQKEQKSEQRKEFTQFDLEFANMQLNKNSQESFWKEQAIKKENEIKEKEEQLRVEIEKSKEIFKELEKNLNNIENTSTNSTSLN